MDFSSMSGKSSMRRKQSNSLLQAFGKPRQSITPSSIPSPTSFTSPPTASSSTLPIDDFYNPSFDNDTTSLTSRSTNYPPGSFVPPGGSRSASGGSFMGGGKDKGKDPEGKSGAVLRRPEDVYRVVKERILSWSYMMEWYTGDSHWLNTVRIPRPVVESILGYKHLENRARNLYSLGISLSALFDIPAASDFLKALLKLLDEWESWSEGSGGKGVKNLFGVRGQRTARKVTGSSMMMSDYAPPDGAESYLLNVNLPFTPDYFQVHASTCSIVRDLYRKLLNMFLPTSPAFPHSSPTLNLPSSHVSLIHHSTIVQTAPREPFINPKSPGASSIATATFSSQQGHGIMSPTAIMSDQQGGGGDALLAFIAGDVPPDRALVGDGQKLTPQIADLFQKVDSKLKKHFSILTREADSLAKRVVDDQLDTLLRSLSPGGKAMRFDVTPGSSSGGSGYTTATIGRSGIMESDRERDFGTV
ncbi:hypothetical protein L198_05932 [Cryptococcus wingfieldii CBS 7118]|uniref:Uncharacterized protein n=1 Tax=Cryptococcus wingfieldii CBS 7118 TaxID=1295528 RepID=A0A1E3ISA8_9TREE|nr:hypothetical protein L198_05932 [Cryptococcus wingfieldii CBS 7118]ODN91418.1 hypothetical protein L198_05932 [Cryptococcus wingfieldii CBS 7118]